MNPGGSLAVFVSWTRNIGAEAKSESGFLYTLDDMAEPDDEDRAIQYKYVPSDASLKKS